MFQNSDQEVRSTWAMTNLGVILAAYPYVVQGSLSHDDLKSESSQPCEPKVPVRSNLLNLAHRIWRGRCRKETTTHFHGSRFISGSSRGHQANGHDGARTCT